MDIVAHALWAGAGTALAARRFQIEPRTVVSWNEARSNDEEALRQRLDALRQWLLWKGVQAEVRIETTNMSIADAILSRATDLNADLIVMGAYGHSRWAERVLGGATRGLLASTVPVLMSH